MIKIIGIHREQNIARKPGSDQRIMNLVADEFKKKGYVVELKTLKELKKEDTADIILNMARSQELNDLLFEKGNQDSRLVIYLFEQKEALCGAGVTEKTDVILNMARGWETNRLLLESEKQDIYIANPPKSVLLVSNKKELHKILADAGVGTPETKVYKTDKISIGDIKEKSVLKAGNRHSIYFVVDVNERGAFDEAIKRYKEEGIEDIIVQKFVDGKFIKYYAVAEKMFLPDNIENEFPHEIVKEIKRQIGLIEELTGAYIMGGDAIISGKNIYFVDVNDWPSYSGAEGVKQEDVAPYIADFVEKKYQEFKNK